MYLCANVKTNHYYLLTSPGEPCPASLAPDYIMCAYNTLDDRLSPHIIYILLSRRTINDAVSNDIFRRISPTSNVNNGAHTRGEGGVRYFRSRTVRAASNPMIESDLSVRYSSVWVRFPFGKQRLTCTFRLIIRSDAHDKYARVLVVGDSRK